MKKLIILITVFFLALNITSCSKEEPKLSNHELLTSRSWIAQSKVLSPTISMNGLVISDIMVLESNEVRNYSLKFNDDGTFFLFDNLNQKQFETTWSIDANETLITLDEPITFSYPIVGNVYMKTLTIESITSTQFIAKVPPFVYNGVNYEITITFI